MRLITRRQGLVGVAAGTLLLGGCRDKAYKPPTVEGLFGVSETLTLATQRLLLTRQSMAREFPPNMISKGFPAINTVDPGKDDDNYRRHQASGFARWRLPVGGLVARPLNLSLADLRAMPMRTQITQHSCERGWSAIAGWTGVQLPHVLALAGLRPEARWVVFHAVDGWWDSLDLFDALHPQTLLAYAMNGSDLPVPHGAPVRLRVERALGWKNLKFLTAITIVEDIHKVEDGRGAAALAAGFPWYAGI